MDRVRNNEVHRRVLIEGELANRVGQRVLRCSGNVEKIERHCHYKGADGVKSRRRVWG